MKGEILVGRKVFRPSGVFSTHFSHNVGKNHETYIEYPDAREISLPLNSIPQIDIRKGPAKIPEQAIYGNWNGRGIFQRQEGFRIQNLTRIYNKSQESGHFETKRRR
ncbi:MAG: hypothetical protein WC720_05370 [Candidatus Shapirobacteria bacterium]|jgi:hypothetical protein